MARVRLIHWNAAEAAGRAAVLRRAGHRVDHDPLTPAALRALRDAPPDVFVIEHNCSDRPYFEEMLESDVDAVSFAYVDERTIQAQHGWDCHAAHTRANVCSERFCLRPSAAKSAWRA